MKSSSNNFEELAFSTKFTLEDICSQSIKPVSRHGVLLNASKATGWLNITSTKCPLPSLDGQKIVPNHTRCRYYMQTCLQWSTHLWAWILQLVLSRNKAIPSKSSNWYKTQQPIYLSAQSIRTSLCSVQGLSSYVRVQFKVFIKIYKALHVISPSLL